MIMLYLLWAPDSGGHIWGARSGGARSFAPLGKNVLYTVRSRNTYAGWIYAPGGGGESGVGGYPGTDRRGPRRAGHGQRVADDGIGDARTSGCHACATVDPGRDTGPIGRIGNAGGSTPSATGSTGYDGNTTGVGTPS